MGPEHRHGGGLRPGESIPTFCPSRRVVVGSLVVGFAGLVAWVVGAALETQRALYALLVAFGFFVTLAVGALVFLMMMHAARAEWPVALRRLVEAVVAAMPLVVVVFIPLAMNLGRVYPWAGGLPLSLHAAEVVRHQGLYWNRAFYLGRTALYFALWLGFAALLHRWSLRQDSDGELHWSQKAERLSGVGLIVLALSLTFAGFDWFMSLTPAWYSSIYGIYLFAGGFVAALALLVVLMARSQAQGFGVSGVSSVSGSAHPERSRGTSGAGNDRGQLAGLVTGAHFLSVGKLVFAHVIFWAYIAFDQYFIIWIADLPHEASWWVTRSVGWGLFSIGLAVGHFFVPFFILLSHDLKRDPRKLGRIAWWLIAMHYFDLYWLIMPALTPNGPHPSWLDPAALAMVLGFAFAFGLTRARGLPVVPARAPGFGVSTRYEGT